MEIVRGDIVYVDLEPRRGSETGKKRPCLVVQNDVNNKYAPTTIIVVITSRRRFKKQKKYPTHVWIDQGQGGLDVDSIIQCEQIRTVDKKRIIKKIGYLDETDIKKVEEAIMIILSLGNFKI